MELICFFLTWNGASVIAMSHALSATTQFRVRWPQIKAQFWTFEQYTVSSPRNAQLGHLDLVLLLSFKRNVKSIREKKKITAEQFSSHEHTECRAIDTTLPIGWYGQEPMLDRANVCKLGPLRNDVAKSRWGRAFLRIASYKLTLSSPDAELKRNSYVVLQ